MKKSILIVLVLLSMFVMAPFAQASGDVTVFINGLNLDMDVPPKIINGRTMVPIRAISENMGANVGWNGEMRLVTIRSNGLSINLTIDSGIATVNGKSIALDQPAIIVNDRTLVPIRFISESMGADVKWDGDNRMAVIRSTTNPIETINYEDGVKYIGEVKNGKANGYGVIYYADGSIGYQGDLLEDTPHGYGIYYIDGDKYQGRFENGYFSGRGTYFFEDGSRYQGSFKEDYFSGYGIMYYADGSSYEGNFKNDMPNGQGTLYYSNGLVAYTGEFIDGEPASDIGEMNIVEGQKLTLSGTLSYEDYELYNGRVDRAYILNLYEPFECSIGGDIVYIDSVQVVGDYDETYLGGYLSISGDVVFEHNSYHHRPIILFNSSVISYG